MISENVSGFLCDVGDVRGMARAVAELAGSPSRLERLGSAAHESTADYAWEPYRVRFASLLADVERAPRRSHHSWASAGARKSDA